MTALAADAGGQFLKVGASVASTREPTPEAVACRDRCRILSDLPAVLGAGEGAAQGLQQLDGYGLVPRG